MALAQTPLETRKFPPPLPIDLAPCTQTNLGGKRATTLSASTTYKGQALTLTMGSTRFGQRLPSGTFSQRFELGGKLLYELTYNSVPAVERTNSGGISPAATPMGRLAISYGQAIRGGPRHVILKSDDKGVVQGFADGHRVTNEQQSSVAVDPDLKKSMENLIASARRNLESCGSAKLTPLDAPKDPNACQFCINECEIKFWAGIAGTSSQAIAGNVLGVIIGLGGTEIGTEECLHGCNKAGGPCCATECAGEGGVCCASNQFCCGTSPIDCCNDGSVCATAPDPGFDLKFCCPAGSKPVGCQAMSGVQQALYCLHPGQTCCGFYGVCDSGQFCADVEFSVCCPDGQSFCNANVPPPPPGGFGPPTGPAGFCCDGKCITFNAGTTAEHQVCCPKPNVVCGETSASGGPTCCPPNNCRTFKVGNFLRHVCCDQPLCGNECCAPGEKCINGKCELGQPCGNTFCGITTPDCCNGVCCERGQCCNNVCCSSTQTCVNGKCTNQGCPPGQTACPDKPGLCCPPNTTCCPSVNTCCPANTTCCLGRGCFPGQNADCFQ